MVVPKVSGAGTVAKPAKSVTTRASVMALLVSASVQPATGEPNARCSVNPASSARTVNRTASARMLKRAIPLPVNAIASKATRANVVRNEVSYVGFIE